MYLMAKHVFFLQLVGHTIKSGGIAITGQEQRIHGGGFDILGKSGLQGEITMLQLYKASLTAGKAYINHKHHHVNDYTHDDDPNANRRKRATSSNRRIVQEVASQSQEVADQQSGDTYVQSSFAPSFGGLSDSQLSTKHDFLRLLQTYDDEQFQLGGRIVNTQANQGHEPAKPATTQTEPAEWEVSKILQACSSDCLNDAFRKANVMPWQETPKKLFGGASYVKGVMSCYNF